MTQNMSSSVAPSVSIGMPVYNGERYLCISLDRLLSQTFTDFELIISDNGSTDGTEAICCEYASQESRVRYLRYPTNRGAHWNFNNLLQEARGQYFMWAAVDDLWSHNYVEALRNSLEAYPTYVSAQGEYVMLDAEGNTASPPAANFEMESRNLNKRVLILSIARTSNLFFYGLHRTEALRKQGVRTFLFAKKQTHNTEKPMLFFLVAAGAIATNREACFHYRIHAGQDSNRKIPRLASYLSLLSLILMAPAAVWRGSHSPLASAITFVATGFYQTASITAHFLRSLLHITPQYQEVAIRQKSASKET